MYGSCTTTCGYGIQIKSRTCNNPVPSDDGRHCQGTNTDIQQCNLRTCPGEHLLIIACLCQV